MRQSPSWCIRGARTRIPWVVTSPRQRTTGTTTAGLPFTTAINVPARWSALCQISNHAHWWHQTSDTKLIHIWKVIDGQTGAVRNTKKLASGDLLVETFLIHPLISRWFTGASDISDVDTAYWRVISERHNSEGRRPWGRPRKSSDHWEA